MTGVLLRVDRVTDSAAVGAEAGSQAVTRTRVASRVVIGRGPPDRDRKNRQTCHPIDSTTIAPAATATTVNSSGW